MENIETVTPSFESEPRRETKESEKDPELQAAAAMERADYLVKEVKSSRQQMQNIMYNMQQVKAAITALRAQLQLADSNGASSLERDEEQIAKLQQQISQYSSELESMREGLVQEQTQQLKEEGLIDNVETLARAKVDELLQQITKEK